MVSGDFKLNASDAKEFATMLNSKDMSPIKAEMESGKFLGENGHELLLQRLQEINASPENTAKMLQLLTKTNKGK